MRAPLTARTIATLKPLPRPYEVRDTKIRGFLLRVQPTGKMVYYLSYTPPHGRRQRYRIGSVGNLTPTQARDIAEDKAADVARGIDVHARKKIERIEGQMAKLKVLRGFLEHKYGPWAVAERKTGRETIERIKYTSPTCWTSP